MRRVDKSRYDFRTNAWVREDFLTPETKVRSGELPESTTPPAPGRWTAPPAKIVKLSRIAIAFVLLPFGVCLFLGMALHLYVLVPFGAVGLPFRRFCSGKSPIVPPTGALSRIPMIRTSVW